MLTSGINVWAALDATGLRKVHRNALPHEEQRARDAQRQKHPQTTQPFQTQYQPIYTLDAALTYALTPNMQLDFGGNFSLNGVAPRTQLYAGLSQRF